MLFSNNSQYVTLFAICIWKTKIFDARSTAHQALGAQLWAVAVHVVRDQLPSSLPSIAKSARMVSTLYSELWKADLPRAMFTDAATHSVRVALSAAMLKCVKAAKTTYNVLISGDCHEV